MKRLSLLLVMIITVCLSFATIDEYYTFSETTGTYTTITGTDAGISSDDAISAAIDLGFTFSYGDNDYTQIKISSNSWIDLGATQTGSNLTNNLNSATICPVLAPLWDDTSMSSGNVQYALSGTAPNRIFTVQYTDVKWNYSGTNQYNYQVRLYETGKIEFVYGPATGTPNFPSASIGINMVPGGPGWFYSVTPGTPSTASTDTENNSIAEIPAEGTIYEFTPVTPSDNDLAAISITGNTTPTQGEEYDYTVSVKNRGLNPQTTYSVKLYVDDVEAGSVAGVAIQPNETLTFDIPWTPASEGPAVLYGKVVLAGDENPNNDQTPDLDVTVQPTGVQAVTIGDGSETARMPMDFYWKNSLYECLFYPDELGFVSGTITSLQFYNNFVTNLPNGATKIWLGTTNLQDLNGGYIPSTQLTLVFDGNVQYPAGQNTITIPLQTPYMHTPGNLVMMVNRPMDAVYYSSSDYFQCQTGTQMRARNTYSDSTTFDPANPPDGTLTAQFPKTTIFYSGQAIVNDMGALSITGNTTPSVGAATDYTITVKNNGTATQNTYTVKLMKEGDIEIASVPGVTIESLETLQFTIPWTPSETGPTYIWGEVELAGDEIATNNETPQLNVVVQPAGIVAVTVGQGGGTGRMPVDMFYKNSLFETIYLASELNIGGLLTAIQFYNSFNTNLPGMPTNIWVGETTQGDLSAGWIPSTELTQVFSGNVDYPSGQNDILITLTTPYAYGGGNLVVMVERPMDTQWYSSSDVFVTQSGTVPARTRNVYSDSTDYDPANPPTDTPEANFPRTTFMFITDGLGSISGTVYEGTTPLEGATVTVANTPLTYTTTATGTYNFPYVAEGDQEVSATKHGYNVVTHTVTVVEDETTTQDFVLTQLPQVTVTGRIVGSDQPTVGIEGATIALSGYEPYEATTNTSGIFTIDNVYASQTYQYVASALGYQQATGEVVVGTTSVNMGDIVVNELAYPPTSVTASQTPDFQQCNVTWQPPDPSAQGISEGFEEPDTFPPTDWTQVITNTGPAGTTGVYPTWCQIGTVALTPEVPPHGGDYQAAMWWDYSHQDEWLITPQFTCPGDADLTFWSYVYFGSTYDDHYYIKVSTDNGATWTQLWDATSLTGGWNYYDTPIVVDLNDYAGQPIKLAWQAEDPPSNDGMWYVWFIDDVTIGSPTQMITFPTNMLTRRSAAESTKTAPRRVVPGLPTSRARVENPKLQEPVLQVSTPSNTDRVLLGYRVYRLLAADEDNETLWTQLTPTTITATEYTDTAWGPLPSGVYEFAVKAVYTNNVMSNPAFSNEIHKGMMGILTGTVTEFGTNVPIEGATITAGDYSGTSDVNGDYSFDVYQGTYDVTCSKTGYQSATQTGVNIVGTETTTQDFVLTEITLPPGGVQAEEANPSTVNVTWMEPGTGGGEWIYYTDVDSNNSIGLTAGGEFSVAIRFPASELTDYAGMSLYAVKVWPADPATFSLRVWTGGDASAPAQQVVNQPFTPTLDEWNTILLDNPVTVTGNEELWFGYNIVHTSGYPAGVDPGPALDGFANMIYSSGSWDTLLGLAPTLNYNWCIQGYVGYSAPTQALEITPITARAAYPGQYDGDRTLGYRVWRLLQGQESNETAWISLTDNPITATAYQDTGWGAVPDGTYKWAVKAIYTGGAQSIAAFSNALQKITQIGTIAGIVRDMTNAPIMGATVTCGDVTATTNASGAYSMQVEAGTWSVTASHPNYASVTQTGVIVVVGQTTTVNFQLPESTILLEDGFESYDNFALEFAPWTLVDVDLSTTYGMSGITWPNAYAAMAYMIFVPSATTPPVDDAEPHGGIKEAACFASTAPPNDDWLITPVLSNPEQLSFWAKSYTDQYGLERFKVGVSTTGTAPSDFTIISGTNYIEAPTDWTEYTYDISSYDGDVYVGIQCVSNDAFIFFVDDVLVTGGTPNDDPNAPVVATELRGNYPNPFNPETTIRYSVKEAMPVTINIYNVKGQLVKTLVNDVREAGNYSVVWNGRDANGSSVSSGVYYFKMNAGKYSNTKKMILMK